MNDVMGYGDASVILEQFALWKDERDKWYFVTIIVLTYCEKKLF